MNDDWLAGYRAGYNDHAKARAITYQMYGIRNGGPMTDSLFDLPSQVETEKAHACAGDACGVCNPGLELKRTGMARALKPDLLAEWKQNFRDAVHVLAREGYPFTSEDVIERVGLPSGDVGTNANNAVGAMMNGLARKGVIRKTGERRLSKRPSSHGAEIAVWVGLQTSETHADTASRHDRPACPECGTRTCSRRPGYPYCYGPPKHTHVWTWRDSTSSVQDCRECGATRSTADIVHTCHPSGLYYDDTCGACRTEQS